MKPVVLLGAKIQVPLAIRFRKMAIDRKTSVSDLLRSLVETAIAEDDELRKNRINDLL